MKKFALFALIALVAIFGFISCDSTTGGDDVIGGGGNTKDPVSITVTVQHNFEGLYGDDVDITKIGVSVFTGFDSMNVAIWDYVIPSSTDYAISCGESVTLPPFEVPWVVHYGTVYGYSFMVDASTPSGTYYSQGASYVNPDSPNPPPSNITLSLILDGFVFRLVEVD